MNAVYPLIFTVVTFLLAGALVAFVIFRDRRQDSPFGADVGHRHKKIVGKGADRRLATDFSRDLGSKGSSDTARNYPQQPGVSNETDELVTDWYQAAENETVRIGYQWTDLEGAGSQTAGTLVAGVTASEGVGRPTLSPVVGEALLADVPVPGFQRNPALPADATGGTTTVPPGEAIAWRGTSLQTESVVSTGPAAQTKRHRPDEGLTSGPTVPAEILVQRNLRPLPTPKSLGRGASGPDEPLKLGSGSADPALAALPVTGRLTKVKGVWRIRIADSADYRCYIGWFPITESSPPVGPHDPVLRFVKRGELVGTADLSRFAAEPAAFNRLAVGDAYFSPTDRNGCAIVGHAELGGIAAVINLDHGLVRAPDGLLHELLRLVQSAIDAWAPASPELSMTVIVDEAVAACGRLLLSVTKYTLQVALIGPAADGQLILWRADAAEPSSTPRLPARKEALCDTAGSISLGKDIGVAVSIIER